MTQESMTAKYLDKLALKKNDMYNTIKKLEIDDRIHSGVISEEIIEINVRENKINTNIKLIKIEFYDRVEVVNYTFPSLIYLR